MNKVDTILVYHWRAWRGFLISHLIADYCHVEANYDDDFSCLDKVLTPNIKAVLPQINLTDYSLFPKQRNQIIERLKARDIKVLNTQIVDISKHNLHRLLQNAGLRCAKASQSGDPDEDLFIKTNLNWGGELERRLPAELVPKFYDEQNSLVQHWNEYYLRRRHEIPTEHWQNANIVIEKYIYNNENSFFRVYCFGESVVIVKAYNNALIKKIGNHDRDSNICCYRNELSSGIAGLPDDLVQTIHGFITAYPLDYFCLDIVHDMQQHYIIDLNLTPYSGEHEQSSQATEFMREGALDCCGM